MIYAIYIALVAVVVYGMIVTSMCRELRCQLDKAVDDNKTWVDATAKIKAELKELQGVRAKNLSLRQEIEKIKVEYDVENVNKRHRAELIKQASSLTDKKDAEIAAVNKKLEKTAEELRFVQAVLEAVRGYK